MIVGWTVSGAPLILHVDKQFYFSLTRFIFGRVKSHTKRPHRGDVTKAPPQSESVDTNGPTPVKAARMVPMHDHHDPNSSDHVVAVTQLKEKIAHLQKQITQKDNQLLTKDRQVGLVTINWRDQVTIRCNNFEHDIESRIAS